MTDPDPAPSRSVQPPPAAVRDAVARALAEDLLPAGDLTASLLPPGITARAVIVARQEGVLAGRACATEAFDQVDPLVELVWRLDDGARLVAGSVLTTVEGSLRSIVTAERTALNFLCHLSGVASLTRRFVDAVAAANPVTRIWDTRKTTPGLRALEKAAVRAGGGLNHRGSLSEGVLVKDNHLAGIDVAEAVRRARERWPGRLVEVECDTEDQVVEAIEAGAGMVMLDNMGPAEVEACVGLVRDLGSSALVEVSGGVTLETAPALARAGADRISVGALTHSSPILDIGLDLEG